VLDFGKRELVLYLLPFVRTNGQGEILCPALLIKIKHIPIPTETRTVVE